MPEVFATAAAWVSVSALITDKWPKFIQQMVKILG